MSDEKIKGTIEAWESSELGQDEQFVQIAQDVDNDLLDDSLELQMISIRLQKSLIEDFKMIAKLNGIGYQPLIRQVLKRFADCEKKHLLRQAAAQLEAETDGNGDNNEPPVAQRAAG